MPYKLNGRTIPVNKSWTDDYGVKHPSNWATAWSNEYKTEMGIVWVEPELYVKPDNRFYKFDGRPKNLEDVYAVDNNGDPILDEKGHQIITEGLKTTFIKKFKEQANDLLTATDWYFSRENETGTKIPLQVIGYRDAVREEMSLKELLINECTTIDEFVALFTSTESVPSIISNWPDPDEERPVVIKRVSMRQARLALDHAGLLDIVDSSITNPKHRTEWEYASSIERDSTIVKNMASALGLTDDQVDELFMKAYSL